MATIPCSHFYYVHIEKTNAVNSNEVLCVFY